MTVVLSRLSPAEIGAMSPADFEVFKARLRACTHRTDVGQMILDSEQFVHRKVVLERAGVTIDEIRQAALIGGIAYSAE